MSILLFCQVFFFFIIHRLFINHTISLKYFFQFYNRTQLRKECSSLDCCGNTSSVSTLIGPCVHKCSATFQKYLNKNEQPAYKAHAALQSVQCDRCDAGTVRKPAAICHEPGRNDDEAIKLYTNVWHGRRDVKRKKEGEEKR
jgi:hypothetical protein